MTRTNATRQPTYRWHPLTYAIALGLGIEPAYRIGGARRA